MVNGTLPVNLKPFVVVRLPKIGSVVCDTGAAHCNVSSKKVSLHLMLCLVHVPLAVMTTPLLDLFVCLCRTKERKESRQIVLGTKSGFLLVEWMVLSYAKVTFCCWYKLKYKNVDVLPIRIVKSNVSSVGLLSERNRTKGQRSKC